MSRPSRKPLPVARLAACGLFVVLCGGVALYQLAYALRSNTARATVRAVGREPASGRTARFWADYEYADAEQARHTGRAEGVVPSLRPGDQLEVQYLRHEPQTSRAKPSPVLGTAYGAVAVLAAVVFAAELLARRRRRQTRRPEEADPV